MTDKPRTAPLRRIENLAGFVVHWLLCGPFNADGRRSSCAALKKDYLAAAGGEAEVRPRAGDESGPGGPTWQPHAVRHGFIVDLRRRYSTHGIVSYAAAWLDCPSACDARIHLGSDDGFVLYLNGQRIGRRDVHRGLGVDSDAFDVRLKRGTNLVILKIEQFYGAYEFCLRVTDPAGRSIPRLVARLDHPRVRGPVDAARARTVTSHDYLAHKFATARHRLAYRARTVEQHRAWRRRFLDAYRKLLGPFPAPCPLKPQITEDVALDGYRRRRVLIDLEPGFAIPCYLTLPRRVPKGRKLPAVLCLHGHGGGKRNMLGDPTPENPGGNREDRYSIALHMAERGYVTISPDFLAFGERQGGGEVYGAAQDPCLSELAWGQIAGVLPTTVNMQR